MISKYWLIPIFLIAVFTATGKRDGTVPATLTPQTHPEPITTQFSAALEVASVFGRSPSCAEASPKLIRTVAEESLKVGIDPRAVAATIAVESGCNQFAASSRGAIGLMQIVPRVWAGTYDFEQEYNLLNPDDNIRVGTTILAGLIKQYGTSNGLRRYNGLGIDCPTCDAGYTDRIAALAARR